MQFVGLDERTRFMRPGGESVIVVTYGTERQLPNPIPSSFDFSTINP